MKVCISGTLKWWKLLNAIFPPETTVKEIVSIYKDAMTIKTD